MWELDLVRFANALAEAVGGSVMIFSPQQEVLAASRLGPRDDPMRRQAVLDQHGPAEYRRRLRERGVYQRLWGSEGVVDIDPVPELGAGRRLAVAVRASHGAGRSDGEILGSLWVAEGASGLHDQAAETLAGAVGSARDLLLWLRAQSHVRRFAEDASRQLLAGEATADSVADRLDVDRELPCAVVSCAPADAAGVALPSAGVALPSAGAALPSAGAVPSKAGSVDNDEYRLADLLAVQLGAYRGTAVPIPMRGRVDVLLCELDPGNVGSGGLLRTLRTVERRVTPAFGRPVMVAIGSVVPTLAEAPRSRAEAALVLRVLQQRPDASVDLRVTGLEEVRAAAELLLLADLMAARPELREGPVATLLAYDAEHGTSFAESLRVYLDEFGDIRAAARVVNVHPNTLRYRLRRIPDICGLDLTDPDERLMAAVQLRIAPVVGRGRVLSGERTA